MDQETNKSEEIIIKPALNPDWRPTNNPIKMEGLKSSTEVLIELREAERY